MTTLLVIFWLHQMQTVYPSSLPQYFKVGVLLKAFFFPWGLSLSHIYAGINFCSPWVLELLKVMDVHVGGIVYESRFHVIGYWCMSLMLTLFSQGVGTKKACTDFNKNITKLIFHRMCLAKIWLFTWLNVSMAAMKNKCDSHVISHY